MRVVILCAFAALMLRLFDVQIMSGQRYAAFGAGEVQTTVRVPAARGAIYDRNGAVLSVSVPRSIVVADPFLIAHPAQEAALLSPLLKIPASTLGQELTRHSGYVVLARMVDDTTANEITKLNLNGLNLLPEQQRLEPNGGLAAPLLGDVNTSGVGYAGLEYEYDKLLAGTSTTQVIRQTPDAVPLPGGGGVQGAARSGTSLELTIDESLQYVTEQSLSAAITQYHAKSGIAVVEDTHTGQILAMANLVADPKTGTVSEAPSNLALTSVYEPGSVFKLVTFSAALTSGVITPQTVLSVPNSINLDGWVFHDAESHPTEQLSATQVLAQSSNIGTIEIAAKLGASHLAAQMMALGYGRTTGLGFPDESAGLVNTNVSTWSGAAMGSTPIGQDDAVTAQQVLDMVNTVATGGEFVPPSLVRATIDPDGTLHAEPVPAAHRVFSSAVSSELTGMMEQVVQDGTAVAAAVPGYTVAGKTGTAQVPSPHGGYIPGAYMATFTGFAPAQNPQLSAVVVLEQPTPIYGGTVAAPVFAQVMSFALHRYGIAPGSGTTSTITTSTPVLATRPPAAPASPTTTIPNATGVATGRP
ncbi:MAG: peptidoglycan D,D-transpeptidase FtsI family protein [Acidimicrobiales bacterium]